MSNIQPGRIVTVRPADLLAEWDTEAQAAHDAYTGGVARGPVTAIPKLDTELGGFLAPYLHVLHGAPGSGKTAFVLQLAATCGTPAVIVTCEMAPLELLRRIAARVTHTFLGRFKTGELTPADAMSKAREAVATCPGLIILDATNGYPKRADIETVAMEARGDARHVLVVVDSVHSWAQGAEDGLSEYESLNLHLRLLGSMALSLNAPVLAVAERNRMSIGGGGMSAGAGTRKLEYGAHSVMDLSADKEDEDEDEFADPAKETPVVLKLPKNRSNRPHGKVRLLFHGACQSFRQDPWQGKSDHPKGRKL